MSLAFPERIVTARTLLRSWRDDEGEALKAALDRNATHLVPWIPWATGTTVALADAEARARKFATEFREGSNFVYAIRSPDDRTLLGGTGLHPRIGPGGIEIGYWVDRDQVGQGLAREVAAALVEVAFGSPGIARVEIHCDERNLPSARVPERLGFSLVGREPREGGVVLMIWRLLRGEHGHLADGTGAP